jgi:peptidyl-prolyl cis-trans isomerase C
VRAPTILLLFALALTACHGSGERSLLATVNDQNIYAEEFRSRLQEYRMIAGAQTMSQSPDQIILKQKILNELIEERLLLSEAKKMGVEISPEVVEDALQRVMLDYPQESFESQLKLQRISRSRFKDRIRTNLMIEKLISSVTMTVRTPSNEEIQKYYEDHKALFALQEQFHLEQIVVKSDEDAQTVLAELSSGKSFGDLAREHSFSSDSGQGGDLGFVKKEEMPKPVGEAMEKLAIGKPSRAIASDYGFHILLLKEKRPARQRTIEEVTAEIVKRLTQTEREERFTSWRKELLSKAKIERNHGLLASIL